LSGISTVAGLLFLREIVLAAGCKLLLVMPLHGRKKGGEREREGHKNCSRQDLVFRHPTRHDISVERLTRQLPVTAVIRDSKSS
jgi:hypothetical protein